jgi:hypothetical protein
MFPGEEPERGGLLKVEFSSYGSCDRPERALDTLRVKPAFKAENILNGAKRADLLNWLRD